MSRVSVLRWASAVAIAGLALLIALGAMRTYLAHEMTLGLGAVVATGILLLVGLASLGAARLRLGRELAALESDSAVPRGWLWPARLARLAEIHAAGARPDPEVLAEVTRAEEAGRAYLGRYLVATTVLIGLVGTFAGLMQTLGKLTPLLGDAHVNGAEVLAAPLAGLHVTFGASLVAILATLALALAQGDLTLCEERVLARLEDRTCHEWIPALWRAGEAPDERVVRAIGGLEVAFAESVSRALAASVQAIGAETRGESERARAETARDRAELGRLMVGLDALTAEVKGSVARLCVEVGSRLGASAEQQARALEEAAVGQARALARTVDAATESLRTANREVTEAMRVEVTAAWSRSAEAHVALVRGLTESGGEALAQATAAQIAAQIAATERATAAVASAVRAVEATAERIGATAAAGAEGVIAAAEASSARAIGAAEAMSARVVGAAEGMSARVVATTEALGARAVAASEGASRRSGEVAEALAREMARVLAEAARQSAGTVEAVAERAGSLLGESVRQSTDTGAALLRETHEAVGRATRETAQLVAQSLGPLFAGEARERAAVEAALRDAVAGAAIAAERLGTLTTALEGVGREHTAAMERGGQAVLAAFEQAVVGGGAALDRAALGLATAARDLQSGADVLGPRLNALGVELGALSREVALLVAARGPDDALGGAVLGELERLGGAVEGLGALVRAGRADAAAAAPGPSEARSEDVPASGQPDEESHAPPPPVTRISDEAAGGEDLRAAGLAREQEQEQEQEQEHEPGEDQGQGGTSGDEPPEPVGAA